MNADRKIEVRNDANPQSGSGFGALHDDGLLVIHEVSKKFGGTQAVDRVSLRLNAGEIVALLGENGAGKSTLIKILAGIHTVDSGSVFFRGREVTGNLRRLPIAFIHQDLGLIDWMTVAESVCLTLGYPQPYGIIDWGAARGQAHAALSILGADINPDLRIQDLSRTEKSLVAIAGRLPRRLRYWCSTNRPPAFRPAKSHSSSRPCADCVSAGLACFTYRIGSTRCS